MRLPFQPTFARAVSPRSGGRARAKGFPYRFLFGVVIFFALSVSAFATQTWNARVLNGTALQGRCDVDDGDVMRCVADVLAMVNRSYGLADGVDSYRYVSRSADVMSSTVGGSVTSTIDDPGAGANVTWTITTDRVGSSAFDAGFMIFLVGLVLCFGHGWIAGGQR